MNPILYGKTTLKWDYKEDVDPDDKAGDNTIRGYLRINEDFDRNPLYN